MDLMNFDKSQGNSKKNAVFSANVAECQNIETYAYIKPRTSSYASLIRNKLCKSRIIILWEENKEEKQKNNFGVKDN